MSKRFENGVIYGYGSRPHSFNADSSDTGRWYHVAITYGSQTGTVIQYFDGREVSREASALHQPCQEIVFGPCEIGNGGLPTAHHAFPIRNLNGAIDEFSFPSLWCSGRTAGDKLS